MDDASIIYLWFHHYRIDFIVSVVVLAIIFLVIFCLVLKDHIKISLWKGRRKN